MPSGLLSNLNTAFGFGFQRALRLKRISIPPFNRIAMAASGTVAASGDLILDTLVSGCGNVSGFAKPRGVYFSDRSGRNCRKASVRMRNGGTNGHTGVQLNFMFDLTERSCFSNPPLATWSNDFRTFSSSYYSDGPMPDLSTDGSSCTDELISLAISEERFSFILFFL